MVQSDDAFVVRSRWRPRGQINDHERFQVLRVRDAKIFAMREYRTGREAMKAAR
jgi:hypothetical protein